MNGSIRGQYLSHTEITDSRADLRLKYATGNTKQLAHPNGVVERCYDLIILKAPHYATDVDTIHKETDRLQQQKLSEEGKERDRYKGPKMATLKRGARRIYDTG